MECITLKTKFPKEVTGTTIQDAMSRELEYAEYKEHMYTDRLKEFEKKYKMKSNDFYKKFKEGKLGDEQNFFEWYAIKEAYDYWKQTSKVLKNVSIS